MWLDLYKFVTTKIHLQLSCKIQFCSPSLPLTLSLAGCSFLLEFFLELIIGWRNMLICNFFYFNVSGLDIG